MGGEILGGESGGGVYPKIRRIGISALQTAWAGFHTIKSPYFFPP